LKTLALTNEVGIKHFDDATSLLRMMFVAIVVPVLIVN